MKILDYRVLSGSPVYVACEVVRYSDEGWSLYGNPHFEPYHPPRYDQGGGGGGGGGGGNWESEPTLYQTMIKQDI